MKKKTKQNGALFSTRRFKQGAVAPNTTQHTHTWARQVGKGGQKGDGNFVFGGVVWYSHRSPETCQDQVGQGIDGDGGAFFSSLTLRPTP